MDTNAKPSLADELVKKYKAIKEPGASLIWVSKEPEKAMALLKAIKRQVEWSVEHAENTSPYHEALVSLYIDCPRFENVGMFELFIDEFVPGMKYCWAQAQRSKALNAVVAAQNAWDQSMAQNPSVYVHGPDLPDNHDKAEKVHLKQETEGSTTAEALNDKGQAIQAKQETEGTNSAKKQEAFNALRASYLRSFIDYYLADANKSGLNSKSSDKFSMVRYIRDSAENLLFSMKGLDKKPDDSSCADVEAVYAASRGHARWLAGGRRRAFEKSDDRDDGRWYKRPKDHRRELLDSYRPSH